MSSPTSMHEWEDRHWLHSLGLAEGIESLIDPEVAAVEKSITVADGWCDKCDGATDEIIRGPEGQHVCPDCHEELRAWYGENASVCVSCKCWISKVDDDGPMCGPCRASQSE